MGTGDGGGHEPVELYGIIEIATALRVDRRKVAVWHGRGKLPPADFRASGRPFWKPETITPWIATHAQAQAEQATATAPEPAAAAAAADQPPRPTPASSPSTPPPSPRSSRRAPATTPARSPSRARGRRAPAADQHHDGEGGNDPYELTRSSHGWTLTYLGQPIGTIRPAWSTTGRSKRWQAYSPSGTRLDARTYPTVQAAAVRVVQAHRHAAEQLR